MKLLLLRRLSFQQVLPLERLVLPVHCLHRLLLRLFHAVMVPVQPLDLPDPVMCLRLAVPVVILVPRRLLLCLTRMTTLMDRIGLTSPSTHIRNWRLTLRLV